MRREPTTRNGVGIGCCRCGSGDEFTSLKTFSFSGYAGCHASPVPGAGVTHVINAHQTPKCFAGGRSQATSENSDLLHTKLAGKILLYASPRDHYRNSHGCSQMERPNGVNHLITRPNIIRSDRSSGYHINFSSSTYHSPLCC